MVISGEVGKKPLINIRPSDNPLSGESTNTVCQPDFVLVRQLVRGKLTLDEDYTNVLYGLMYADLPAVNSLESVHRCLERPIVHAALNRIKLELGDDVFPLINQTYYSSQTTMLFTPNFPLVAKVGYAEAGYGKMKFDTDENFNDFRGLLAIHKDYVTLEELVQNREYDLRIQKIGTHLRAYKRTSSNWKGNVGASNIEEIPVTEQFEVWANEAGKLFGGIDILTVDAIHTTDGQDFILEINDSASGFLKKNEQEDMGHCRDLVLERMGERGL